MAEPHVSLKMLFCFSVVKINLKRKVTAKRILSIDFDTKKVAIQQKDKVCEEAYPY